MLLWLLGEFTIDLHRLHLRLCKLGTDEEGKSEEFPEEGSEEDEDQPSAGSEAEVPMAKPVKASTVKKDDVAKEDGDEEEDDGEEAEEDKDDAPDEERGSNSEPDIPVSLNSIFWMIKKTKNKKQRIRHIDIQK